MSTLSILVVKVITDNQVIVCTYKMSYDYCHYFDYYYYIVNRDNSCDMWIVSVCNYHSQNDITIDLYTSNN